jgi:hypothetical protein
MQAAQKYRQAAKKTNEDAKQIGKIVNFMLTRKKKLAI